MTRWAALLAVALLAVPAWGADKPAPNAAKGDAAAQGALLPRDSRDAAVFRGGLVFSNYCITCHGINADGNGRAARLYSPRPANLRMSDKNDAYLGLIIRMGGQALGRSEFMPPWGAELTDEQMKDLVAYLRSINARAQE
jgi:mono/diheme cytochrome c family protein